MRMGGRAWMFSGVYVKAGRGVEWNFYTDCVCYWLCHSELLLALSL